MLLSGTKEEGKDREKRGNVAAVRRAAVVSGLISGGLHRRFQLLIGIASP